MNGVRSECTLPELENLTFVSPGINGKVADASFGALYHEIVCSLQSVTRLQSMILSEPPMYNCVSSA